MQKISNYKKIKGMSVEELAEFLHKVNIKVVPCIARGGVYDDCPIEHKKCKDCFKEWLEGECDVE